MHQRGITSWWVRVRPHTQTQLSLLPTLSSPPHTHHHGERCKMRRSPNTPCTVCRRVCVSVFSVASHNRGSQSWGRPLPPTTPAWTSDYGPRTLTAIAPFAFLSTNVPPTNMVVQSIPVSTCRFLVVTKQTDGAIFVGGCEAHGGSA